MIRLHQARLLSPAMLLLAATLAACSAEHQVERFTAGDLANAAALATKGNDPVGAMCWTGLEAAAASTPQPGDDGLAVLGERARLAAATVSGACGGVIAPVLVRDVGKIIPLPVNLALPF
jgi:hypothetical protein